MSSNKNAWSETNETQNLSDSVLLILLYEGIKFVLYLSDSSEKPVAARSIGHFGVNEGQRLEVYSLPSNRALCLNES